MTTTTATTIATTIATTTIATTTIATTTIATTTIAMTFRFIFDFNGQFFIRPNFAQTWLCQYRYFFVSFGCVLFARLARLA
jgi:hypothetical protein